MGGEKFDTPHPEGYLFGENMDLNFLGNRPVQVFKGTSVYLSLFCFKCSMEPNSVSFYLYLL